MFGKWPLTVRICHIEASANRLSCGFAQGQDANFVSGGDNLKDKGDTLRTVLYAQNRPYDAPVKLLRRGTFTCNERASDCTFKLARATGRQLRRLNQPFIGASGRSKLAR